MNSQNIDMPFWDHLEELRWCLIKSLIAIILGAIVTYNYCDMLLYWLIAPSQSLLIEVELQVLKVTSMFSIKLIVSLFGGIIIGLPVVIYQFWQFVSPAFKNNYNVSIFIAILFSTLFFIMGLMFAYFVIIPFSLHFFTSIAFEKVVVEYNFSLEGYLIYVLWLIFGCGILFQFPVITIFFTRIGIFTAEFLRHYRKVAITLILILGAVLTPPDPFSQILIVIPLIILYELSILISVIMKPKKSVL
tara:strand:+ start:4865 stop:5602 length:738 start_codon:yes stop_codon:yes gene_type:complete